MKALLIILSIVNFFLPIYASPITELGDDDNTPGKIHQLYQQHYSSYKNYLKKFNKKHDSSVPELVRLLRFVKASKMIDAHNKRYKHGLETYEMGLNEMSDWTDEENKGRFGLNLDAVRGLNGRNITHKFSKKLLRPIPSSIDYRKMGVLGPVKQQGTCGVCYIFTAVAALEAYTAIKTHKPVVSLSEQNVMDCSGLQKCDGTGGDPQHVWNWIANTDGIMAEKDYPYQSKDNPSCYYKREKAKAKVFGSAILPSGDEEAVKRVLAIHGPVVMLLYASLDSFKEYKTGIYNDPFCPKHDAYLNHAVLAVGYGEENGQKYYIIKNSWGETWGQKGYGRIAAGVSACGLGSVSYIPLV